MSAASGPARPRAAAALFLLSVPTAAAGQGRAPVVLDPVVVSASRLPAPLARTPNAVTVITRAEIEASAAPSVTDLLRHVPGLHIDQPGGRGGVSSVYLRGADPNFTLVLIDGIEVNDPTNTRGGSFDFSTLSPEAIERIEIVRGPLSAVYGSDAMAGVINIVTREGTAEPQFTLEPAIGTEGYRRTAASARGSAGWARYALTGSWLDNGVPAEGGEFVSRALTGKVTAQPAPGSRWQMVTRYADSEAESFPDDSGGPDFALLRATEDRDIDEFTAGLTAEQEIAPRWTVIGALGYTRRDEAVDSPGVAPGARDPFGIPASRSDSRFERTGLTASALFRATEALRLTVGGNAEVEKGSSDSVLFFGGIPVPGRFALDRTVYAGFAEAEYAPLPALTLTAGLRVDFPERLDAQASPRLGAVYAIESTGTILKANWGEGFKLPSFYALGNPIVGDPDLDPETSRSFDASVIQSFWSDRASARATVFHSDYENVIDFIEGPPPRLANLSAVRARGVELALGADLAERLRAKAHLSYTDTDIRDSAEVLRSRPEWRGGVIADWQARDDLFLHADLLYVGATPDSSIPTGDRTLADYVRVDLAATWRPRADLSVVLAIDNLFDADYEEAVGFPAPGIRPRLAVEARF